MSWMTKKRISSRTMRCNGGMPRGETWGVQRLSEAQRYPDLDELCTPILLFPHVSGPRHLLYTTTLFPSLVFSATVPAPHHANKALLQSLRDDPGEARRGIVPTVVQASGQRRRRSPR